MDKWKKNYNIHVGSRGPSLLLGDSGPREGRDDAVCFYKLSVYYIYRCMFLQYIMPQRKRKW